jgi:RNA polymerase sigma-70 factor (sigma-E family)
VKPTHEAEYEAFVLQHRGRLLATALHLTGDAHLAEDLVQNALVRLYLAWGRARTTSTAADARRILLNGFVDHQRRPWVRRERAAEDLPDSAAVETPRGDPELMAALAALPPRMRAAVVLRHVEDLSVEDVADALGCSTGTVKSQTARGLDKLRAALPDLERNPS